MLSDQAVPQSGRRFPRRRRSRKNPVRAGKKKRFEGFSFGASSEGGTASPSGDAFAERPCLTFDPRRFLGDSLELAMLTAFAEAHIRGHFTAEDALYARYLTLFPEKNQENSAERFAGMAESVHKNGFDYMCPVAALPEAFAYSDGIRRMAAAVAADIREIPYLRVMRNVQAAPGVFKKRFPDADYRWILAQQQRLINALPREQRLLCEMRKFINFTPASFKDAPFSSNTSMPNCILPYQGLEKIGLTGKRSTERRFTAYRLGDYLKPDMDVLETGCNCGFLSWLAAQRVRHVDAFDVNADYIWLGSLLCAEYETENLRYCVSRFEDFTTELRYDLIMSCSVYDWVPLPFTAFVDRLDQWLKPGGILLLESHELITHPEWREQKSWLADRYDLLHAGCIDDVNHMFYASEYREFLLLRKRAGG